MPTQINEIEICPEVLQRVNSRLPFFIRYGSLLTLVLLVILGVLAANLPLKVDKQYHLKFIKTNSQNLKTLALNSNDSTIVSLADFQAKVLITASDLIEIKDALRYSSLIPTSKLSQGSRLLVKVSCIDTLGIHLISLTSSTLINFEKDGLDFILFLHLGNKSLFNLINERIKTSHI